jgi:hypothetical protein
LVAGAPCIERLEMDFVTWLQNLSRDASPTQTALGQPLYVMCIVLPVGVSSSSASACGLSKMLWASNWKRG